MTVDASGVPSAIRDAIRSWGWQLTATKADAALSMTAGGHIEIRVAASSQPDDVVFPPLQEGELKRRIEMAQDRRTRFAKRLHDLRSPLNAIQGYAEIIAETAEGDVLRFASNIRTASELLVNRLESIRDEGV